MEIVLIRHGECHRSPTEVFDTERRMLNGPLTERGVEQANRLSDRCRSVRFDRIYSSDLIRAEQTARILATRQGCDVQIDPAFREINMGELYREPWEHYPEWLARWSKHEEDIAYPNGENGADVWNRCNASLSQIVRLPMERIAIVAHGGTIRCIVCGALGIPLQKRFYFGSPIEHCSISILLFNAADQKFTLHALNDASHLTIA